MSTDADRPPAGGSSPDRAPMGELARILPFAAGDPGRQLLALALAGVAVRLWSGPPRGGRPASRLFWLGLAAILMTMAGVSLAGYAAWHAPERGLDLRLEVLVHWIWGRCEQTLIPR